MHKDINVNVSGPVQPTSTYKTKVLKGNHSFASQVTEPNMKYVIKHDFDLGGKSITIPANCVLEFDGGSISNGKIINSNFYIKADRQNIFKNICFFDTISGLELLNDGVSVKVTQNNSFFNAYTKKKAVIDDIVNISFLYKISDETSTIDVDGNRVATINGVDYTVNDANGNYNYKTRNIVGINASDGSMLTGELLENRSNEKFYSISRIAYNNSSTIKNTDIYPEWFKSLEHIDDTICLSLASLIASLGNNNVLCEQRDYNISAPIPVRRGCKIIGVFGDIWERGTIFVVNSPIGLFIYDINTVAILVKNITFVKGVDYDLNYIGIELQAGDRNVVIDNVNFQRANIAININAYWPVEYTKISNVTINSCKSILFADGCFKARGNVYINGNYFNIKGVAHSSDVSMNEGMKFISCSGNNVQFTASESLGTPTFYIDDSTIEIIGLSWNESSSYICAYNNSFVSIVGDGFFYGSVDCDSSSVIIRRKETIRNSLIVEENLKRENNVADFLRIDGINRRYIDKNGRQIGYIPDDSLTYKDGKYYITGEVDLSSYSNTSLVGKTIFLKVKSVTAGSINLGFVSIAISNTAYRDNNLLIKSSNVNCGYFNINTEQLIYITVGEDTLSVCGREYVAYTGNFDTIKTTGGTMVSDILIVDGEISNRRDLIAYKKIISDNNISNIPQLPDYAYGQKEWYRPINIAPAATFDIYKLDVNNARYVNCKGDTVATIPSSTMKRNINGKNYITRSFNTSTQVTFLNDYQIDLKNKTLLVQFAVLGTPPSSGTAPSMNFGFNRIYLSLNNDGNPHLFCENHSIMFSLIGEHMLGLKCAIQQVGGVDKTMFTSINRPNFPFEASPGSVLEQITVFTSNTNPVLFVGDLMIVDKVIESEQEFLYYQDILRNSNIPGNTISGSFANKPSSPAVGTKYFCTSGASIDGGTTEKTNIPIYYTGSGWVDSNGTAVVAYNG